MNSSLILRTFRIFILSFVLLSLSDRFASAAQGDTRKLRGGTREASDNVAPDPAGSYHDRGLNFGIELTGYYDPLGNYSSFSAAGASNPMQFSNQTFTGLSGLEVLAAANVGKWAFQSGIDYMFPITVQTKQTASGNFTVNNQTLKVYGLKLVQVGYRLSQGDLTLTPYGGVGVYYGKNILNLNNVSAGNQQNEVTYFKLMSALIGGMKIEYNFNRARTLTVGVGAEALLPMKIEDQLSQKGSFSSELPGYGNQLRSNLNFMDSVSGRLMLILSAFI